MKRYRVYACLSGYAYDADTIIELDDDATPEEIEDEAEEAAAELYSWGYEPLDD